jgi:tetratricopeptide (TPR) repeat protein
MSNPPSTTLRDALFAAILKGDDETLTALCNRYAAAIVEYFPEWTTVPVELRTNQDVMRAWGQCLMTLASLFEDQGIPDLMERLTGGAEDLFVRWRNTLAHASALAEAAEFAASSEVLSGLVAELERAQGDIVDNYRPKAYGLLGANAFQLGRYEEALRFTKMAVEDCRRSGDTAGVRAYTENLRILSVAVSTASDDEASLRLRRIRATIARAQDASDDGRFDQSNTLIDEALADIAAAQDGPGGEYRGKALGLLGLNHFRLGDTSRAHEHTSAALDACRAHADADGIRIYEANLARIDPRALV